MNGLNKNKSGIFLMELMLVILFISLALTICVRIFFAGERLSKKSYTLTNSVIQAENVAQLLKHDAGKTDSLIEYYRAEISSGEMIVYFDKTFQSCTEEEKKEYKMVVRQKEAENGIIHSNIVFSDFQRNEEIYSLDTKVCTKKDGDL